MPKFDLRSLEELLRDFYNLTGLKTCLYDTEGNELCFYPSRLSEFCHILRQDASMDEACRDCDKRAFANCRKTRSQYAYTCHAGLQECVSPIVCDNRTVGFIMIGQIKGDGDAPTLSPLLPSWLKDKLCRVYAQLPHVSAEKRHSAFRILDACAGYELLKTLAEVDSLSIDAQIDKYIHDNLAGQVSVAQLCSELHLSRYEIYRICDEYFYCTPGEYIKKCRLSYACRLLCETALSINRIAVKCGIGDYNYFSKTFKSAYGMSPTAYRKAASSKSES